MKKTLQSSYSIFLITLFLILPLQGMQVALLDATEHKSDESKPGASATLQTKNKTAQPKKKCCNESCCNKGMYTLAGIVWAGYLGGLAYLIYNQATKPYTPSPAPFQSQTFCLPPQTTQANFNLTNQPWTFQARNHITGINAQGDSYCTFDGDAPAAIGAIEHNSGSLFAQNSTTCVTTQDPETQCIPYTTHGLRQKMDKQKSSVSLSRLKALEKCAQRASRKQHAWLQKRVNTLKQAKGR